MIIIIVGLVRRDDKICKHFILKPLLWIIILSTLSLITQKYHSLEFTAIFPSGKKI